MSLAFFKVFLLGWTALLFVEAFLGVFSARASYSQYLSPQGQLSFRRPLALRSAVALCSFTAATWPLLTVGDPLARHTPIPSQTWMLVTLTMLASLALSLVLIRASGPEDVVLTPETRTYRRLTGWPIFPRIRSGTFDDIAGIYVWSNGGSGQVYLVYIAWVGQAGKTSIGNFGLRSRATQFADEVSKKLGVKRVDPPQ